MNQFCKKNCIERLFVSVCPSTFSSLISFPTFCDTEGCGFTSLFSFAPLSQNNTQIYVFINITNLKILNHAEWSSGEFISQKLWLQTTHTPTDTLVHTHARYPIVPYITHVPHRGESSVSRVNRLIMMPIHYQALGRPLHCFPFIH